MLISLRVEHERLFSDLRAVVIDEVHTFAGDDRGWHLADLDSAAPVLAEPTRFTVIEGSGGLTRPS